MTEITLTAIYEEAEEGGYIGYSAELPGANTQGETMEEVRENLIEAMQMILEANREETERRLSSNAKVTREPLTSRGLKMNRTDLMEAIGGFYVLDCESMKEAVEWANRMPNYGHGAIEVRPVWE